MPEWPAELRQLRTAKAWGLTPREWRQESMDDRALMTAVTLFEATVEGYRQECREKKADREREKQQPQNDFSRMKERLRRTSDGEEKRT